MNEKVCLVFQLVSRTAWNVRSTVRVIATNARTAMVSASIVIHATVSVDIFVIIIIFPSVTSLR